MFFNVLRVIIGVVMLFSNIGLLYLHFTNNSSRDENPVAVFAQILIALVVLFPKSVYWGRNKILHWILPAFTILALLWIGGYASLSGMGKELFKSQNEMSDSEQFSVAIKNLSIEENAIALAEKQLKVLHETSQELNSKCPMKIDAQTQLDHTIAGPGLKFTYYYTLFNMPNYNNDIDKKLYEYTVNYYRSNTNLRLTISMGVTYCSKYRNEKGTILYEYCINKETLEQQEANTKPGQRLSQADLPLQTMYNNPSAQKLNELTERINNEPSGTLHYYNRGVYYMAIKEYNSAISDFNKAILLDSTNALAYAYRGHTKICMRDNKGAIDDCSKAINITDFWGVFFFIRAKAYLGINEYEKATDDLVKSASKKYRPAKNVIERFGLAKSN